MARNSEPTTAPLLHTPAAATTTKLNKFVALLAFLSLASAVVFAVLYFSNLGSASKANDDKAARPLSTLRRPAVVLISSDGFRFGYEHKTDLPNIRRLISNGTSADAGLISSFPTLTFPNHYSIATGLYPSHHGIVNHKFVDPATGDRFNMSSHDPRWWLGEPLWETVARHNLTAAVYSWPGSEVKKGAWDCPPKYCPPYNLSVPFEERVDAALAYFDTDGDEEVPSLVTLYFDQPDHLGHQFGPDDEVITESVARIDDMIGRLIAGLEERRLFEDVNIVLLGDHGMVGTCESKLVFLEDLSPWVDVPRDWVEYYSTLLSVRPPPGVSPAEVVEKMRRGLGSGRVENGAKLRVYLKEELPGRLHYSDSERIPPIIGMPDEGYLVLLKRSNRSQCGGAHGYDNAYFSMRSIFVGHGPRFRKGWQVPSFENVEVYNVVNAILGIDGAPNDGSPSFPQSILLPTK
ncbi:uncharacterized protein M6B38_181405 [Iris pallida]|uniref:Uncharacterized protein n=1 Tax=Iris pallida TaxID=29817 RepID=A0AAX6ELS5_IRIPA|nr:uncharacterized protein M6B38_181405 [Iris pallida]